jgi:hypothetical protein
VGQALLVYGSPQVVLLTTDLHEYFIDVEGVTVATMLAFQTTGIDSSELDAPEADCFPTDGDASFSEQVFDITVTEIKSIVEPDCVTDNFWWEPVAYVSIHASILSIFEFNLAEPELSTMHQVPPTCAKLGTDHK